MTIRSRAPLLLGLAAAVVFAACEPESTLSGPIPTGWFVADIEGGESIRYKGTGFFHSNKDLDNWPDELQPRFIMHSNGLMESVGAGIAIVGGDGAKPGVGLYELGWSEGGAHDWNLTYTVSRGDSLEIYGAIAGELEITKSEKNVIEGEFDLVAKGNLVCHRKVRTLLADLDENVELPCVIRSDDEAQELQITGSFQAISGPVCMALADTDPSNAVEQIPPVVVCF